jgi:2-polyprenyl-6-methoxyphenol hydroxylase-like FAD-dependent oxidoreductase
VVLGASIAGAFAAAAAAGAGHRVTLLERDVLPAVPGPRDGVPQGRQAHVLLAGGLRAAERLLPGFAAALRAAGAVEVDTGHLAWLSEPGWSPYGRPQLSFLSATRPLLEHLVQRRVRALAGVDLREGVRVTGLRRGEPDGPRWWVDVADSDPVPADVVVDATGRSSRLPHWLAELGVTPARVTEVDARVGYSTRVLEVDADAMEAAGVVVLQTPTTRRGGIALPVEGGRWLVGAVGSGDDRPPRDADGYTAFLAGLSEPALREVLAVGSPVGDVAVHRQTSNRRHHVEEVPDWPDGLVVVGDALCAFNPVYGQGITVAAQEALLLRRALTQRPRPGATRRLQRRFARVLALPWGIATGEDRRYVPTSGRVGPADAAMGRWVTELGRLGAHGDHLAAATVSRVYHLVASPWLLLRPGLLMHAVLARLRGRGAPTPRPPIVRAPAPG